MTDKLKPCPFCPPEKNAPWVINPEDYMYYVKCLGCGCMTGSVCSSKEQAIEKWNSRWKEEASTLEQRCRQLEQLAGEMYVWADGIINRCFTIVPERVDGFREQLEALGVDTGMEALGVDYV